MYHSCGEVDNEGRYAYVGSGSTYGKSLPSSQFSCELKTALKKVLKKNGNIKITILIKRKTNKQKNTSDLGGGPMVRTP